MCQNRLLLLSSSSSSVLVEVNRLLILWLVLFSRNTYFYLPLFRGIVCRYIDGVCVVEKELIFHWKCFCAFVSTFLFFFTVFVCQTICAIDFPVRLQRLFDSGFSYSCTTTVSMAVRDWTCCVAKHNYWFGMRMLNAIFNWQHSILHRMYSAQCTHCVHNDNLIMKMSFYAKRKWFPIHRTSSTTRTTKNGADDIRMTYERIFFSSLHFADKIYGISGHS